MRDDEHDDGSVLGVGAVGDMGMVVMAGLTRSMLLPNKQQSKSKVRLNRGVPANLILRCCSFLQ